MRACARRAYCEKCRVNLGSKRSGWSSIPDVICICRIRVFIEMHRYSKLRWPLYHCYVQEQIIYQWILSDFSFDPGCESAAPR
jgi:hypothetical protein